MFCVSSWKGLKKRVDDFEKLGVRVLGVAADTPEQLRKFRDQHHLPFTMLSDPQLLTVEHLDVPRSTTAAYLSVVALHPVVRSYPKKAFLQPALFIWKGKEIAYEWRQTEKLRNLFGANGRPDAKQIIELTRETVA